VWHNSTRMHYRTNLSADYDGKSGYGIYADGMMELDDHAGVATGEFMAMEDWIPTIISMLGQPDLVESLKNGSSIGGRDYRVHLDGVDQTDLLTGRGKSKRVEFYYFTETSMHGLRYGDWKVLFKTQDRWFNGIQQDLTTPLITNVKLDPFERFHEARGFDEWQENHAWLYGPAATKVMRFLATFTDFPPRMRDIDIDIDIDELMNQLNPARPR